MNFKNAFLLSGILLLSVFVLIQFSWACDDDDKWDHDYHDKWHWDHHCWTCNPPKIQRVYIYYEANSIIFEIYGKNFAKGGSPVVTLGGIYHLTVDDNYGDEEIIATLPIEGNSFPYGDYRLVVSTCHDSSCEYKYCKDYCFKCKGKHCKDYCSRCKDRYCKHKYCKDHEYKCRCKDRYSLTIADPEREKGPQGPAGPPGPPGIASFETISIIGSEIQDAPGYYGGTASCSEGFKVTGGGFFSQNLNITASGPFDLNLQVINNGWRVEGTPVGAGTPYLQVWAVCVKVEVE